jgi:hypothetical protein
MHHQPESSKDVYPHGRGYGHDYMRGGEVFGGYGYSERDEYHKTRGELGGATVPSEDSESVTEVRGPRSEPRGTNRH